MSESDTGFQIAIEEAKKGATEGGIPIGACLVAADGKILGRGHNMRIQKGSSTLHVITSVPFSCYPYLRSSKPIFQAEISTLENSGRLPASAYTGATMYTTLSPCDMCTGACIMYGVARVVIGENKTFVGGEQYLKERGVVPVVFDNQECKDLMRSFIKENPKVWYATISQAAG